MKSIYLFASIALGLTIHMASAQAEPQLSDPMRELGIGTTLTVNQAINFPAGQSAVWFRDGVNKGQNFAGPDQDCLISFKMDEYSGDYDTPEAEAPYDRELPRGTVLKISQIHDNYQWTVLEFENSHMEVICQGTIADFENQFGPEFTVQLATPVRIR